MSIWSRIQGLNGIREIYGVQFPLEIRHYFSNWIESQKWDEIHDDEESSFESASRLYETLVNMMHSKISELQSGQDDTFLLRLRLEEIIKEFEKIYSLDPLSMVKTIRACLEKEIELMGRGQSQLVQALASDQFFQRLSENQKRIENSESQLKNLQQQQESFVIQYQELKKLQAVASQKADSNQDMAKKIESAIAKKALLEKTLSEDGTKILKARQALSTFYQNTLSDLTEFQKEFYEKIENWKDGQCTNTSSEQDEISTLNFLQLLCEKLVESEWMVRQQLKQFSTLHEQLYLKPDEPDKTLPLNSRLMSHCTSLLKNLVQLSFVFEKQPPQVLKTQTKFAATTRLLVGGKLNICMNPPEGKACIVSQVQAKNLSASINEILQKPDHRILEDLSNTTGTLLNERKLFEYTKENNNLKCNYKNLSLKKIKRRDTKSDETVTEEKFALVTYCLVVVGDLSFYIYVISNPIVVIVHGNQYSNALATILWDNFFREKNREPFVVPDKIPWEKAASALNTRFYSINTAPLKDSDLDFLKMKLFGHLGEHQDCYLSWTQFNRETLTGRQFSFWEWFHGIEELVKKYAHDAWRDGLIVGFITKREAENYLLSKTPGNFLLRFSDSEIGGISVAWVGSEQGVKKVWHLQPWFSKDLMIRSLADRLGDLPQLTLLYPNRPKETVFGKYYSRNQRISAAHDYVRTSIAATVLMENLSLNKRKAEPLTKDDDFQDFSIDDTHDSHDFLSSTAENDSLFQELNGDTPSMEMDETNEPIDLGEFLLNVSKTKK